MMNTPTKHPKGSLEMSASGASIMLSCSEHLIHYYVLVEHAFTLWADKIITIESVGASKSSDQAILFKPVINPDTSVPLAHETAFNDGVTAQMST